MRYVFGVIAVSNSLATSRQLLTRSVNIKVCINKSEIWIGSAYNQRAGHRL